jgi:hypothetical protein
MPERERVDGKLILRIEPGSINYLLHARMPDRHVTIGCERVRPINTPDVLSDATRLQRPVKAERVLCFLL